jgi:hypothetical protein
MRTSAFEPRPTKSGSELASETVPALGPDTTTTFNDAVLVERPLSGIFSVRVRSSLMIRCVFVFAVIVAGFALHCTPAMAEPAPDPAEQRLAREEAKRGLDAARADRWDEAREAFQRAYGLWQRPSILFNLAGAQAKTGLFVEAAESYRALVKETSEATEAEREIAREELAKVEPRIAHVRIVVRGGAHDGDLLSMDGRPIPLAALDADLPANPGTHEVSLVRMHAKTEAVTLSLASGETRALTLSPIAEKPLAPARSSETPTSRPITKSPWFWGAIGILVIGATIGGICLAGACTSEERKPHEGSLGNVEFP